MDTFVERIDDSGKNIISGHVSKKLRSQLTTIVVKGKAAVDSLFHAIVFTQLNTTPKGKGKTDAVSTTFQTQCFPFNCLKILPAVMPPTTPHNA